MTNSNVKPGIVKLENREIKIVESYVYLWQFISLQQSNQELEINRRVQLRWAAFGRPGYITKSNLPLSFKKKVFNQCTLPTMTCAAKTWTLGENSDDKLAFTERVMEGAMIIITGREKWRNNKIRQSTKAKNIITKTKELKWQWAGRVTRRMDNRWTKTLLIWTPRDGVCSKERQWNKWTDKIVSFTGENASHRTTADRTKWRKIAEAFVLEWNDYGWTKDQIRQSELSLYP